jgi:hypothetical protein
MHPTHGTPRCQGGVPNIVHDEGFWIRLIEVVPQVGAPPVATEEAAAEENLQLVRDNRVLAIRNARQLRSKQATTHRPGPPGVLGSYPRPQSSRSQMSRLLQEGLLFFSLDGRQSVEPLTRLWLR